MEQVIFGGYYNPLHNTDTEENSLCGGDTWSTNTDINRKVVASAGNLKNLRVKLNDSPGNGKHYDFTILKNGNPTALTLEIADLATSGSVATPVAVVAGDLISLECNPDGTPTARYATWTCMFDGTTAKESLILGGAGATVVSKIATEYNMVMGARDNPSGTENDHRQVCPTAGIIKNLYVVMSEHAGAGTDAYRFTLRLNGATVVESLIVTLTQPATTGNDTSHNLDVAAGDILTMMIEPLNTPSATPYAQWGMTFLSDTDGESIVMSGSSVDLDDTATEYAMLQCTSRTAWGADETVVYQLGQVCTLKNLYIKTSAAPGDGKSYVFNTRIPGNGQAAGNLTVTITGAGTTTGNDTANTDVLSNDDYVDLEVNPDGTPDVVDAYWGLVCYIEPPVWDAGNINGVPAANIAAVDGIPVANIAKIDGI